MTLALVGSLVFVAAGGVLLVMGGTVATATAMSLLGFACVIWVSLAFFAVGRSEDRDRAAGAAEREALLGGAARPSPPPDRAPADPHVAPPHEDDTRTVKGRPRHRRRP